MTLRDIFNLPPRRKSDTWLYLAGIPTQWTLDTEALLIDHATVETDEHTQDPILSPKIAPKGFQETLDLDCIVDCVKWADRLSGRQDDDVRMESFRYYVRFDAFLPKIGAPDPPSREEIMRKLDLEFYDKLGPEDLSRPCKQEGCERGATRNSVLCKQHHFKMIKHRDCPFHH